MDEDQSFKMYEEFMNRTLQQISHLYISIGNMQKYIKYVQ